MENDMTTTLSPSALHVWREAADHQAALVEAHRLMVQGDKVLTTAMDTNHQIPTISDLHRQASVLGHQIEAAQAYRRDLLKLLALAGGYDKEG